MADVVEISKRISELQYYNGGFAQAAKDNAMMPLSVGAATNARLGVGEFSGYINQTIDGKLTDALNGLAELEDLEDLERRFQDKIDSMVLMPGDTTNHLVYLGLLSISEPTSQQLTEFAQIQAAALFGVETLKTGFTVRDAQDRDWRWVDDGDVPPPPPPPVDNRMYDAKDGQYYDVIESGGLFWTTRNYSYAGNGNYYNAASSEPFPQAGRLYSYAEATANAPNGWRLPLQAEFEALVTAAGNGSNLTKNGTGSGIWTASGNITHNDTLEFGLLPAGYYSGSYQYLSTRASIWLGDETNRRAYIMNNGNNFTYDVASAGRNSSIRYVKGGS